MMALDIETMPTVDDPDFNDPSHWRVFAIALGAVSNSTDLQTTVLLRKSDTQWAEYMLIARAIEWLQARDAWTIVTYNGQNFDLPILRHRARAAMPKMKLDTSAPSRLDRALDAATHRDLFAELRERRGERAKWLSLEEACHKHDITISSARYDRQVVTGEDMPRLGARILDVSMDSSEAERAVREYASEDVRPLLELAQKLDDKAEKEVPA